MANNVDNLNLIAKNWAYDLPIRALSQPLIVNEDVINQSIEMILATPLTSRLFNINFGSNFTYRIFDNMDIHYIDRVIDDTITSIKKWEDRITIIDADVAVNVDTETHTVSLTIPYYINNRRVKGEFSKMIKP